MVLTLAWAAYREESNGHGKLPDLDLIQEAAHMAIDRLSAERGHGPIDVHVILTDGNKDHRDATYAALVAHFRTAARELEGSLAAGAATVEPDKNVEAALEALGNDGLDQLIRSAHSHYLDTKSKYASISHLAHEVATMVETGRRRRQFQSNPAAQAAPSYPGWTVARVGTSAGTTTSRPNPVGPSVYHHTGRDGFPSGWPTTMHGSGQPASSPALETVQLSAGARGWQSATGNARIRFGARPTALTVLRRQEQQGGTLPRGSAGSIQAMGGGRRSDSEYAQFRQAQNAQAGPSMAGTSSNVGSNQMRWSHAGYPTYAPYQQATGFEPVSHQNEGGWPRHDPDPAAGDNGEGWFENSDGQLVRYHRFI